MATEFGVTAWGRAWLRTIERIVGTPLPGLGTARSHARNNTVVLTDISAGNIAAEVTVRGTVSTVTIAVPLWEKEQLDAVTRALRAVGTKSRSAPTGELPDSVVADLRSQDIAIAADLSECSATCDCTGKRTPCVHHLATIYALAGRIDEEPALAVTLRSNPRKTRVAVGAEQPGEWIPLHKIDASRFYGD